MSTPFFVTVPDMYDGSARSRGLGWMYEAESDDASLSSSAGAGAGRGRERRVVGFGLVHPAEPPRPRAAVVHVRHGDEERGRHVLSIYKKVSVNENALAAW